MKKQEEQFIVQAISILLKNKYFEKVIIATKHKDGMSLLYGEVEESKKDDIFNQSLSTAFSNVIDARVKLKEEEMGKKIVQRAKSTSYTVNQDGMKYE